MSEKQESEVVEEQEDGLEELLLRLKEQQDKAMEHPVIGDAIKEVVEERMRKAAQFRASENYAELIKHYQSLLSDLDFTKFSAEYQKFLIRLEGDFEHMAKLIERRKELEALNEAKGLQIEAIIAETNRMRAEIAAIKQQNHEQDKAKTITKALADGKITEEHRAKWERMFDVSPKSTAAILADSPPIVPKN